MEFQKRDRFLDVEKTTNICLSQVKISVCVIAFNFKIIGKNGYEVVE